MTFFLFLLSISLAVYGFGIGSWIYFERRDDPRNVTLASLLFAASFWVFAFALMRVSVEPRQISFWYRALYVIASLIPPLFFLFARVFPRGSLPAPAVQALLFAPNVVLFAIAFFTPWLAQPDAYFAERSGRFIFGIHFTLILAAAAVMVGRRLRDRQAAVRDQARVILVAGLAFVPLIWALYVESSTDAVRWLLPAALAVETGMLTAVTVVVRRHIIVEARFVGAEVFFSLAFAVFVVDLVITESTLDFSLRMSVLILLALYGGMTAKTLVAEVRRREEIQALYDQLLKVNGHLLALDRMKTNFVSMASHQLRAPLGGIRAYMTLLRDGIYGPVSAKQVDIINSNVEAADRLLATIESFLDIAKIELGKLEIIKTPTSLKELADKAVHEFAVLAAKKNVSITIDVPASVPKVNCDAGKVYHVIINLVDNALKYTESGSITLTARREKDVVVVGVMDTGVGLTPDERKNLFRIFSRGNRWLNAAIGGSGLGLYILKSIVEAHGG
ncbi:hypothetical protein HY633_01830, partial [Candidatus Uhrbacteria bacterium]|nr:hypothetical protein [Candidatus Uhrbacteria bacterium]